MLVALVAWCLVGCFVALFCVPWSRVEFWAIAGPGGTAGRILGTLLVVLVAVIAWPAFAWLSWRRRHDRDLW